MFQKYTNKQTKKSGLLSYLNVYFLFYLTQYLRNNFKKSWAMRFQKSIKLFSQKLFLSLLIMGKKINDVIVYLITYYQRILHQIFSYFT